MGDWADAYGKAKDMVGKMTLEEKVSSWEIKCKENKAKTDCPPHQKS